ncbi:MAG TPA: GNAT family N-acetyltransferase [Candidatus Limnocylindrales bacterium]|nr:GNAT family N-acetyltransferase [Candidatus Limnocylindrales bacterium]
MISTIQLETKRLRLIAGHEAIVRAEIDDRAEMARLLGVAVPGTWPPPLNDEASIRYFLRFTLEHPGAVGYGCWYWMLKPTKRSGAALLIGNGGFKGLPSEDGTIEVGYSVLEGYQGKGYATEGVRALIEWAFRDSRVRRVIAETMTDGAASQRVLRKNGFAPAEEAAAEAGAVRFALSRETWIQRGGASEFAPEGA